MSIYDRKRELWRLSTAGTEASASADDLDILRTHTGPSTRARIERRLPELHGG